MNDDAYRKNCLTEEELGTLAIRMGAQRRGSVPSEGQSAEMPAGLSLYAAEPILGHLHRCSVCRGKLIAEVRIYREYFQPVDTTKVDAAIRQRIEADLHGALKGRKFKILFFQPDEAAPDQEIALAAATERPQEPPLMFTEPDERGDLILKTERDPATGAEVCYLVGGDPNFTRNAEVLIDGRAYRTDAKGRLQQGSKHAQLSEDTIIVVFPAGSL